MKSWWRLNRAGYTLLELMLATVIMVLGVVSVVGSMGTGITADRAVESRTTALLLAQEAMEDIRNMAFASVVSAGRTAVAGFTDYDRETVVSGTDPKQVTVTVYWTHQNTAQRMDVVALRTNLTP